MVVCIRLESRRVKLVIDICANSAFWTVTSVRSSPRILVERRPIASTVPSIVPNLQKSPTFTGRSAYRMMPPMKFSSVGRIASAIARLPTPMPARMP